MRHPSRYSVNPSELWDYYFRRELEPEADDDWNRVLLLELIARYGIDWVWEHRRRLLDLMRYFAIDFAGSGLKVAAC